MIKKLHLVKANPGSFSKEKSVFERIKTFNNGFIEVNEESIIVHPVDNSSFSSILRKTEEDFLSLTYQGTFEDGTKFRIIRPGGVLKQITNLNDEGDDITFGGMTGDGYAIHFNIVDITEPNKIDYTESRDTICTSAIESKAERLVVTADSLFESNLQMASEHLYRFMNILSENDAEFLKFEHISNILYGFSLAIRLKLISNDDANTRLSNLMLRFTSSDHLRFERGVHVSGPHGGAGRGVEIVPNYKLAEGYLVTIYNQDGLHPIWGNNIQMAPKQMKVLNKSETEFELRGFGKDMFGNSFSDYGMILEFNNSELCTCTLHMYDRGISIKYLK